MVFIVVGKHEKEAFAIVEKEFLSEFDDLNNRIFNKQQGSDSKSQNDGVSFSF